jgi:hypothetical protein
MKRKMMKRQKTKLNELSSLRYYIKNVIAEVVKRKKLRVFDFDDTLAFTSSKVFVDKPDGTKLVKRR